MLRAEARQRGPQRAVLAARLPGSAQAPCTRFPCGVCELYTISPPPPRWAAPRRRWGLRGESSPEPSRPIPWRSAQAGDRAAFMDRTPLCPCRVVGEARRGGCAPPQLGGRAHGFARAAPTEAPRPAPLSSWGDCGHAPLGADTAYSKTWGDNWPSTHTTCVPMSEASWASVRFPAHQLRRFGRKQPKVIVVSVVEGTVHVGTKCYAASEFTRVHVDDEEQATISAVMRRVKRAKCVRGPAAWRGAPGRARDPPSPPDAGLTRPLSPSAASASRSRGQIMPASLSPWCVPCGGTRQWWRPRSINCRKASAAVLPWTRCRATASLSCTSTGRPSPLVRTLPAGPDRPHT